MQFEKIVTKVEKPVTFVTKTEYKCPKCDCKFSYERDTQNHYVNSHILIEKISLGYVELYKFASRQDAELYANSAYWNSIIHGKSLYYVVEYREEYEPDDGYVEKYRFIASDVWLAEESDNIARRQYAYFATLAQFEEELAKE